METVLAGQGQEIWYSFATPVCLSYSNDFSLEVMFCMFGITNEN